MRIFVLGGLALAISACGGGADNARQANDANAMMADNMMMDQGLPLDHNMSMNGMMDGADMGADANMQNMMMQDLTTNDPDTNLANGM